MFFFPECRFVNIALFKKKVRWGIEKEYSIGFVYLLCIFINFHIIEKAPQREGEKKKLLPADDKSKSRDICLDMDINIYQTMKCCYTYIRILIYSYDMCFHAIYDLRDSCHLEVKVKEEKNKPYWMPIC